MDFLSATAKMKVKVVMQNISSALQYAMREDLMNSVEEQSHQLTVGCDRMDDPVSDVDKGMPHSSVSSEARIFKHRFAPNLVY
ncbi:hypothetical protein L3X38_028809 [Prunus dulcis]|uniref:Uncharacterized protein n=1 Tax=Prunus dulcis TaxID=3755 RepID=A0AAD4VSG4_PRUDU|nr:hypothetical protein L3X38_028809 [Prunus dulcis]